MGIQAGHAHYWWSNDGLRLHYRAYGKRETSRGTILCLPGLTRNARDFANLATALADQWHVICPDLRGRGDSGYAKDALSYTPLSYLQDIVRLLDELQLKQVVVIGTSLGGILAMLLAATAPDRLAGAVLNDIGPDIASPGLERIKAQLGRNVNWPTWVHAARGLAEINRAIFPDYTLPDWLAMAKRLCRLSPAGRIILDYDARIAEPFKLPGGAVGVELWPAFQALAAKPLALVRRALSDILSPATVAEMQRLAPTMTVSEIPQVGHVPTLDEPQARAAIMALLAKIDRAGNSSTADQPDQV
jgi:pimeloyl-ACP methyl ester carboxylesterase